MLDNPKLTDIVLPAENASSMPPGLSRPQAAQPGQTSPRNRRWPPELAGPLLRVAGFSLGRNLLALAAPFYVIALYGRVLGAGNVQVLISLTLAMALVAFTLAAVDVARGQIVLGIADQLEDRFGTMLLHRVTAPAGDATGRPTAGLVGRDLDLLRQFTGGPPALALLDLPCIPLFLIAMAFLQWGLALVAFCIAGAVIALSVAAARQAAVPTPHAHQTAGRSLQFGDEVTRHADCASTMGLGPALTRRWQSLRRDMLASQTRTVAYAISFAAAARFSRLFAQSAMLGFGAFLATRHAISGGAMFASAMLLGQALAPVEGILAAWRSFGAARDAVERLRGTPAPPAAVALAPRRVRGELTLEGISWAPPGTSHPALRGITLKIEAGATLAVIGPSAAGKTTLARVLCGALRPAQGIVRLDGAELGSWNPEQLSAAIGYLPQDVALFSGTVAENIARFGDATELQILRAAKLAGAHEMILHLPGGYATAVDETAALLSAGQRQRVALARALFNDPPVLVLDEPNASLDAEGEAALIGCMVEARRRRRTVIMITHNTALVRVADFVATMVGGHILKVEQTAALLGRPARLAATANG